MILEKWIEGGQGDGRLYVFEREPAAERGGQKFSVSNPSTTQGADPPPPFF